MTIDTIVNVYRIVKNSMDGIRPYQAEIVIKKRGWGSLIADTVYTPPRGKGIVEKKMGELLKFLNDDESYPLDPLLKMIFAHYQFEAIHPFRDGNGRTGRILCILYLIQKRILDLPILYLSSYILNIQRTRFSESSLLLKRLKILSVIIRSPRPGLKSTSFLSSHIFVPRIFCLTKSRA